MKKLIELKNIKKIFLTDEVETHALKDISLTINQGDYLSISGPSGCGKSTLLSILGLLDVASEGSFILSDKDVVDIDKDTRAHIRNKEIGFVFQSFNLISDLSVEENVELPLTYRKDLSSSERKQLVKKALDKVDMGHRNKHFPAQLSGGQQQRVAVARAIAGSPSLILADEPTGNIDSNNAQAVMNLLNELHQEGATICMVTHDPRSARCAERIIELFDGQIVADNPVDNQEQAA